MKRLGIGLVLAGLLFGCAGDNLVDGDYLGDPLVTFDGTFQGFVNGESRPIAPALAVIWTIRSGQQGTASWTYERITSFAPISSSSFPWNYTFSVYDLPPDGLTRWILYDPDEDPVGFALGMVVAFDDADQDGRIEFLNPNDPGDFRLRGNDKFVGMAREHMLMFGDHDYPTGEPVQPAPIPPPDEGFQLLQLMCGNPVGIERSNSVTVTIHLFGPGIDPDPNECASGS